SRYLLAHHPISTLFPYTTLFRSKIQPTRQMIESAPFGAGKKSKRDDSHGFLSVITAVAVRHPSCAEDLQFAKKRLHKMWRKAVRSEEHTSELQSPDHVVCRLLLE